MIFNDYFNNIQYLKLTDNFYFNTYLMNKFTNLGLSEKTIELLESAGFENPTEIQKMVIQEFYQSQLDILGESETGSGKTLAFGLPILEKIDETSKNTQTLILAPTRELAIQVAEQLKKFKGNKKINISTIYGGQSISKEINELSKGVQIVVGTTGRVIDHINKGRIKLNNIQYFVLDEFDEMLKMGFIDDVEFILSKLGESRRLLFFSATVPAPIKNLINKYSKSIKHIKVKNDTDQVKSIKQYYYYIEESQKFPLLCRLLEYEQDFYGIIFCNKRIEVDKLKDQLVEKGYNVDGIHGLIAQNQREFKLNSFKKKHIKILICTDVAARGIDVNNLTCVINYNLPEKPEEYKHRIGRTGRAGKSGIAYTFISKFDRLKVLRYKGHFGTIAEKGIVPTYDIILKNKVIALGSKIENEGINSNIVKISENLVKVYKPLQIINFLLQEYMGTKSDIEEEIVNMEIDFSSMKGSFSSSRRNSGGRFSGNRSGKNQRSYGSKDSFSSRNKDGGGYKKEYNKDSKNSNFKKNKSENSGNFKKDPSKFSSDKKYSSGKSFSRNKKRY